MSAGKSAWVPHREMAMPGADGASVHIRTAAEKDAAKIAALSEKNIVPPWKEAAVSDAIGNENAIVLVAEEDVAEAPAAPTLPTGYLIAYTAGGETELESIAVDGSQRQKGIGHALLMTLFAALEEKNVDRIFLEVRETNAAAKAFYKAHGFVRTGTRKQFYTDTGEDAAVYRKDL